MFAREALHASSIFFILSTNLVSLKLITKFFILRLRKKKFSIEDPYNFNYSKENSFGYIEDFILGTAHNLDAYLNDRSGPEL